MPNGLAVSANPGTSYQLLTDNAGPIQATVVPLSSGGGAVLRNLTRTFWVDPSQGAPPPEQVGNIEGTFATLAAALSQCTDPTKDYRIFCQPVDYSAETLPVVSANTLSILNIAQANWAYWGSQLRNSVVLVGAPWVCGASQLILSGCLLVDMITTNNLAVYWTDLNRVDVTGNFELYNSRQLNQIDMRGGNITGIESVVTGILTVTVGNGHFDNCTVGTQTWTSAAGGELHNVTYNGCAFAATPISDGGKADDLLLTLRGCTFPGGGCTFDNSTGAAGYVDIDAASYANQGGNIYGFTTVRVSDKRPTATITVAVPAIVAAGLDYADVSTVGTTLEGLPQDTPVHANPTADLAAAGAGNGGYLNCRVSAASTIRCAFAGILAGGNVDFVFTSLGPW